MVKLEKVRRGEARETGGIVVKKSHPWGDKVMGGESSGNRQQKAQTNKTKGMI